jgi:hypothetical protein
MEQRNQQSDQQDVIAAVHLLVRSLPQVERETLLATLVHEQNEYGQIGDPERRTDDATELAQSKYPIQPLVLDSEESHGSAVHLSSEGECEATHESGSEGRYGEKVLATYASFFLPLAASFPRRRWWGYLVVSTIFLLIVSFSTLVSYKAGMQVGMTMNRPSVVSFSAGCMPPAIIEPHVGIPFVRLGGVHEVVVSHEPITQIGIGRNGPHIVGLVYQESMQCSLLPYRVIAQP